MTIEAGVLSLRITETGAEQVLRTLNSIDAKARALGNAMFNAPSTTGVNGQLQQLSANYTKVGQAAASATPAVDKHALSQQKAATAGKAATSVIGEQILGYYSLGQVVNSAVKIFDEFNAAADRQTIGQRRLAAVASLTGTSLGTVSSLAQQAQDKFKLGIGPAAELTGEFVKLAMRAGNVAQTGQLMTAWMDLAAANGLTTNQAMQALTTTLAGQDEGLNRLGLMNPSQIWKKWADATGTTVAKMTDQEKWQSLVNEAMEAGGKVRGEYGRFLDTVPGKQQAWNSSLEAFNAHIGTAGFGVRSFAYDIGTTLVNAFVGADAWIDRVAAKTSTWFRMLVGMGPSPLAEKLKPGDPLAADPSLSASVDSANQAIEREKAEKKRLAEEARKEAERERKRAEAAARRERESDLRKAMDVPGITRWEFARTYHGPAGPSVEPSVGLDSKGKMRGVKAFGMADVIDKEFNALSEKIAAKGKQMASLALDVGSALGGAFADGLTAAFDKDSDKNFFEAFGNSLLRSLGNIVMQLGGALLTYGLIASTWSSLLIFTPFAGITMGAGAAIAAGAAMLALGAGMGAIASANTGHRTGGAGAGGRDNPKDDPNQFEVAFDPDRKLRKRSGPAVVPSARGLSSAAMPEGRPPIVFAPTIIGTDDKRAQRAIASMVESVVKDGGARALRGRPNG